VSETGESSIDLEIAADDIDGHFAPRARPDVASVLVGTEIVLGRVADGTHYLQTCALNESGSVVWQCFDGSGTIDEIAADIADVFGAEPDAVGADVLTVARDVGALGFLVGVHETVVDFGEPSGIDVGQPFPAFAAHDETGAEYSIEHLRGRRTLLVSWSDTCHFCGLITDDLAALTPSLAAVGVDIVLFATGDARAIRAALDRGPLSCRLLLQADGSDSAFDGMGTPVAYLIDKHGTVAESVALGATEVVSLARALAGTDA
jgi:peroxiredoxin